MDTTHKLLRFMQTTVKFANCIINTQVASVKGECGEVHIEPKALSLFLTLYGSKNELISRDTLIQAVWPNQVVGEDTLNNLVAKLRRAFKQASGDDSLVKTVPRKGYLLVTTEIDELQPESHQDSIADPIPIPNNNAQNALVKTKHIAFLGGVILVFVGLFYYVNWSASAKLNQSMLTLHKTQTLAYSAFVAQVKRRNELVTNMTSRLGISRDLQYEIFFAKYFDNLSEEETFIFSQIRGITQGQLLSTNTDMLTLLENNPEFMVEIPRLEDLRKHLSFWVSKYHTVFKVREDMCLLYAGVEDGVPYPSGVDDEVKKWLIERNLIET